MFIDLATKILMKMRPRYNSVKALLLLIYLTAGVPTLAATSCAEILVSKSSLVDKARPSAVTWLSDEIHAVEDPKNTFKGDIWGMPELTPLERPAGGSQGGRWFVDKQGRAYFGKTYDGDLSRMINEHLVNRIYYAMGVPVAHSILSQYQGKPILLSQEVLNAQLANRKNMLETDVLDHFVIDAWLANWDVVGMSYGNVLNIQGTAVRIDMGGAMFYRAQGELKDFSTSVPELQSLRDPRYAAGTFFSKLTAPEIAGQIRSFADRYASSRNSIRQSIDESGFNFEVREKIKMTLEARFFWLMNEGLASIYPKMGEGILDEDTWATGELKGFFGKKIWQSEIAQLNYIVRQSGFQNPGLTTGELIALKHYTGGEFDSINDSLRDQDRNNHWQWINEKTRQSYQLGTYMPIVRLMMNGLQKLTDFHGTVRRVANLNSGLIARYTVGQIFTEKSFTSATNGGSAPYPGNTTFIIESKHGKSIEFLNPYEKEVLFLPNGQFLVTSKVKDSSGHWTIQMSEQ